MSHEKIPTQLHLEDWAGGSAVRRKPKRRWKRREPMAVWVEGQECVGIPLSKGALAIVDKSDAESLVPFRWCVETHGKYPNIRRYAMRVEIVERVRIHLKMHRVLIPTVLDVDHKNGNGLDNRRVNLRPCTESQNQGNRAKQNSSSRFKGTYWCKRLSKWIAQIGLNGTRKHLGCFLDEIEAAMAYNVAAVEKWGEFARLNPIPKTKQPTNK